MCLLTHDLLQQHSMNPWPCCMERAMTTSRRLASASCGAVYFLERRIFRAWGELEMYIHLIKCFSFGKNCKLAE